MSYDIELKDPVTHETIMFDSPHIMFGGTYAAGGSRKCDYWQWRGPKKED